MRKPVMAAALAVLSILTLAAIVAPTTQARSGNEVVLLRCTQTTSQSVGVADSSSSAGAPTFAFDASCSQALADLLDDGFEFEATRGNEQFLYTMVKGKHTSRDK
jgi:hypothetical protein